MHRTLVSGTLGLSMQYILNYKPNQMSINMSENHSVEYVSGSLWQLSIHIFVMILSYTHNVGFRVSSQRSVVLTSICLSCRFHVLTFLDNFCEVQNQSDRRMTEISPDLNQRLAVSYQISSLTWFFCLLFLILKKTTYALKTPHVVALPFIYGVECIQFHTLLATLKNVF